MIERSEIVPRSANRPGVVALGLERARVDLQLFFRNTAAWGFTLLFPLMLLVLFGAIFSGTVDGTSVTFSQLYVAGIIGSATMNAGFVSTAISISLERESGLLKRLAGTPMPKAAYFIGKGLQVLAVSLVQVVILLIVGVVAYDIHLPSSPVRWFTFVWVFILGVVGSTLLGIAVGGLIPNAKASPAIVNLPFVALQFISGVFIPITQLSSTLRTIAGIFPLRWLCQGMRSVFLPESFKFQEQGGSWQHPLTAVILAAWLVVGFVLCLTTFQWLRKDER